MDKDDKILYKLVRELNGLKKSEAFDVIRRIELLLKVVEDPIDFKNLEHSIFSKLNRKNQNKEHYIIKYQGHFYTRIDYSDSMHLFQKTSGLFHNLKPFRKLYFKKTLNADSLTLLNKRNLKTAYRHTSYEKVIDIFLKNNSVMKRDPKTNRYKIVLLED